MTLTQQIITISLCAAATLLTRCLPFLIFSDRRPLPPIVKYLGWALPSAVFAMLVVYCLRNVSFFDGTQGLSEIISIAVVVALHLWRRQMLLSIAGGTICYMLLIQFVFI